MWNFTLQLTFQYKSVHIWNSLPKSFTELKSIKFFKQVLRNTLEIDFWQTAKRKYKRAIFNISYDKILYCNFYLVIIHLFVHSLLVGSEKSSYEDQ